MRARVYDGINWQHGMHINWILFMFTEFRLTLYRQCLYMCLLALHIFTRAHVNYDVRAR